MLRTHLKPEEPKKELKPVLPLGSPGSWESQSHAGSFVLSMADGFPMWYLGSGESWGKTAWKIEHATSPDGSCWITSGDSVVLDVGDSGAWDAGTFMSSDIIVRDSRFLFWHAVALTAHGNETKMTLQIGHGTSQ